MNDPLWDEQPFKSFKQMAEAQLGTVGSGNHYVDVFVDESEIVWVGVHFGSRGLGHKTATYFLKQAGGKDGIDVDPAVVSESDPVGQAYIAGMKLAGRYAYAGREFVARHVVQKILGRRSRRRCITITTLPGRRSMMARSTGSSARCDTCISGPEGLRRRQHGR